MTVGRYSLHALQRSGVLKGYFGSVWKECLGCRVQIQVPGSLAGKDVTLQPAIVERKNLFSGGKLPATTRGFYEQFLNGNWIDPKELGQFPNGPMGKPNPADFTYKNNEQHRVWQAWIKTPIGSPILEVEINYPSGVLQRADGRGYLFRLALERSTSEADRANNAFNGELKEDDGIGLNKHTTQVLKLNTPT